VLHPGCVSAARTIHVQLVHFCSDITPRRLPAKQRIVHFVEETTPDEIEIDRKIALVELASLAVRLVEHVLGIASECGRLTGGEER